MKNSLQKLIGILNRELELYRALLTLLEDERGALVLMNIDAVHDFNLLKERLLFDIETTEIKRRKVMGTISEKTGIPVETLSVSRLYDELPIAEKKVMCQIQQELNRILHEIEEANAVNKLLVEKTDKFLSRCIKLIKTICTPVSVYMSTGLSGEETSIPGGLVYEKG